MTPGIDPTTISPGDALVAVKSFPRRWRGAFAVVADEEEGEELLRRGSPSALDLLASTVGTFRWTEDALRRIRATERPKLEPPRAPETVTLDDLEAAANALAHAVETMPPDDWNRVAELDGDTVTALDLVRRAVIHASDDLRAAERTLRAVIGRPDN